MSEPERITCLVSGKARKNGPEERVRQQVLRRLLRAPYGYAKEDLDVELRVDMGSDGRRADIAIFRPGDPHTQQRAYIIVECKRAEMTEQQLGTAAGQLHSYLSASANALWGVVTNGSAWVVVRKEKLADGTIVFSENSDIPPASAPRASYTRADEPAEAAEVPPPAPPAGEWIPRATALAQWRDTTPTRRYAAAFAVAIIVGGGVVVGAKALSADNDGSDPGRPVLAPNDAGFVDARGGWGWGDRCWNHLRERKYGWAMAECNKGLKMGAWSPSPRPSLLYNVGLIEKDAGNFDEARRYFQQSLALREHPDVRAALNALPRHE